MKQKSLGILIGKKNYSESSLILSFYTEENGLISFIFKGAKKKKLAIFQLGIYEIVYFKRPESNLGIINSLEMAVTLTDIYSNPQKLILSFFVVETLSQTLKTEQPDTALFTFIRDRIVLLESLDELILFPITFLTDLIKQLGFSPLNEQNEPSGFDLKSGRFTHEKTQYDEQAVKLIYSTFVGKDYLFDISTAQKALLILLDYCKLHFPNFNIDNSLKIIRETLYFG
jgi:DNA repair protein RecO (recombination protein O)